MKVRQMMKRRQRVMRMNKVSAEMEMRLRANLEGLKRVASSYLRALDQAIAFMALLLKEQQQAGTLKTQDGRDE